MQRVISTHARRTLTFDIESNGKPTELKAVPRLSE
jgi:hypothetical protein